MMATNSNSRPSVFLTRSDFSDSVADSLRKHFDVEIWDHVKNGCLTKDAYIKHIRGKFGVYCSARDIMDRDVIEAGVPSLKVVSTMSAGLDHLDVDALTKFGIKIGHTPHVSTEAVAELTLILVLICARRVLECVEMVKSGGWSSMTLNALNGQTLHESTVGIVGFGQIGHSVAVKLKTFAVAKILYSSREQKKEATKIGAILTDLDTLMRSSDFVIITISLTPDTVNIINRKRIALMKPNAIFINVGRGGLVDQEALVEALQQKKIKAAGLDVVVPEPLPVDHPLQKLENCVILPHVGSATNKARKDTAGLAVNNLIAVFEGKSMPAEYIQG